MTNKGSIKSVNFMTQRVMLVMLGCDDIGKNTVKMFNPSYSWTLKVILSKEVYGAQSF